MRSATGFVILWLAAWCLAPSWCFGDDVAFRRHVINPDSEFMAAAVFDINKDGKLDIACGGYWYEAPKWTKHFLRTVELKGGRPDGYAHQVLDVNGDGWPDLVTVNWRTQSIKWIEHPGINLGKGEEWKAHTIATPGSSETGRIVDILGDGTPTILPNGSNFAAWWELRRLPILAGGFTPEWIRHELPRELAAHGIGSGDINGDGRLDIVGRYGWAEGPKDPRKDRWIWHPDFDLDSASIPILVVDVDGDGLNDIVWTRAHDYGMYWLQQTRTKDNQIKWIKHTIDTSVAGCHSPLWEDLDGDGIKELVVGRRYFAHEGSDPGEYDPQAGYRYQFDRQTHTWKRWVISFNDGICYGLDPKVVDLTGSGRLDIVCGGRHGLYWLENTGKGSTVGQGLTNDPLKFPSYADHMQLLVVKDDAGAEKPVKTQWDWGQRRAHILASLQAVMGALPESYQRVPLEMTVLSETTTPEYTRKKITYGSDLDSRVPAYLLIPTTLKKGTPAMICLHDDTAQAKDEPVGLGGRRTMRYADELAKRGFVCLVPDYPSYGENDYDFKKHAAAYPSGALKAAWDNIRGIDLLETIPEVNTKRIGIIGHGLGGQSALLTAALDYRLSAVISSCGFTTFSHYKGSNLNDWAKDRMMPRIRSAYNNDRAKIPFDFTELIATLAPRGVFVSAPLKDEIMEVEGVKEARENIAAAYQFRKAGGVFQVVHPAGGRDFDDETRAEAYKWLDQRAKGSKK